MKHSERSFLGSGRISKRFIAQLLVSVAILLLLSFSFLGSESARKTLNSVRATFEPAHINISRTDYDAALATWRSHNISEYAISVRVYEGWGGHEASYRVSANGKQIRKMYPILEIAPVTENFGLYKKDTIEGIFEEIDKSLNQGKAFYDDKSYRIFQDSVTFDADFGYPTHLQTAGVFTDSDRSWRVTSFTVITANDSGNPHR